MEFFQEPTFTALLALILSFIVAKIVTFAVSNSTTDGNTVVCSVNESAVAKEVVMDRELKVRSSKGKKRVKFVDDVVIRRIDPFEGSEIFESSDDVGSVGEVILEKNTVGENSGERVDQENGVSEDSGERKSEEQCFDVRERDDSDAESKGSEMWIEKEGDGDNMDRVVSEIEKSLVNSEIAEEQKIGVEFDGDNTTTDEKEGKGVMGTGESEGVLTGDKDDDDDDDDDDDWEGIERSELEKVFAEAVNYVEYGGKGKDDHLAKLSGDVLMELYGLHKVALEGPCTEPSPMPLKLSARARWNAWQRLGSMNQEAAMEQYIRLLTDGTPDWMLDYSADDDIQRKMETVSVAEHERKSELSGVPVGDSSTGQSSVEKDDVV